METKTPNVVYADAAPSTPFETKVEGFESPIEQIEKNIEATDQALADQKFLRAFYARALTFRQYQALSPRLKRMYRRNAAKLNGFRPEATRPLSNEELRAKAKAAQKRKRRRQLEKQGRRAARRG